MIRLAASIGRRPTRTVVSGGGRGNGKGGGHNSTSEAQALAAIDALDTGVRGSPDPDSITLEPYGIDIPEASTRRGRASLRRQ
jgi:hypothetical protein